MPRAHVHDPLFDISVDDNNNLVIAWIDPDDAEDIDLNLYYELAQDLEQYGLDLELSAPEDLWSRIWEDQPFAPGPEGAVWFVDDYGRHAFTDLMAHAYTDGTVKPEPAVLRLSPLSLTEYAHDDEGGYGFARRALGLGE